MSARVYIRGPWAALVLSGLKTVETAAHGLPARYRGRWLRVQNENRQYVGRVKFSGSFKYTSAPQFAADAGRHCVPPCSPYHFKNRARCYGWIVAAAEPYKKPKAAPAMPGQFRLSEF